MDKDEQDIEKNFEQQVSVSEANKLTTFKESATKYFNNKKQITIRVSSQDIEAIKIKASKLGLAYQTYINMLIHKDVTSL